MMTLMQLIKLVLDDAYRRIHINDEAEKDAHIKHEIDKLSTEYGRLTDTKGECIDYSDALTRFAYIYKYTVAHADYIMQLIRMDSHLRELFTRKEVEIACLGGGPGSDLLGVLKHMISSNSKTTLTCYIFDKERAWGDSWSRVAKHVDAPFRLFPVFQQMDVTDSQTWASYEDYLQADLFTLSFFMSEVWRIRSKAEPFFDHCFARAKSGSLFLFIDNNSSQFYSWFDYLANQNELQAMLSGTTEFAFCNEEEKRDLGVYFDKFGWPKRKSNAAYRIMRKK
jgi:hypothetical protein